MAVNYSNPDELGKPLGAYSHVATGTGRLVSIAGQVGMDPDGNDWGRHHRSHATIGSPRVMPHGKKAKMQTAGRCDLYRVRQHVRGPDGGRER